MKNIRQSESKKLKSQIKSQSDGNGSKNTSNKKISIDISKRMISVPSIIKGLKESSESEEESVSEVFITKYCGD